MKNSGEKAFIWWIGAIFLFCFSIFVAGGDFSTAPFSSVANLFLLGTILVGIVSFLIMIFASLESRNWNLLAISGLIFIMFFLLLPKLPNAENNPKRRFPNSNTSTNDPLGDCNFHANCGGGIKRMRQSECVNSTCCQVGDVWVVKNNTNECKLAQQDYLLKIKSSKPQTIYVREQPRIEIPKLEIYRTSCSYGYFGNWNCRTTNY